MKIVTRKFTISVVLLMVLFGIASTASALQMGSAYAGLDLLSFKADANKLAGTQYIGDSSASYTFDQDEFSAADYFNQVYDEWAIALSTPNGSANASTSGGISSSTAIARAGEGYGPVSGAIASTSVSAVGFYMPDGGDITLSIDYYLQDIIDGDEPGYATAGSGAMLGIYQYGDDQDGGHWLDFASDFGTIGEDTASTLSLKLTGLEEESWFTVFAGTAAYAYAYAPGDDYNPAPVPEPATLLLLGTGLIGIAGFGKRRFEQK